MDRSALAALICWAVALAAGAIIGDVSPTLGGLAALAGASLLAPIPRPEIRIALCGFFGGWVLLPALATPWPWVPLVVATGLRYGIDYRQRIGAAAIAAVATMLVLPFLGNTTLGEIGLLGLGALLMGLGAPIERGAGVPMAIIAGFAAAQGYQLELDARSMPMAKIAPIAANRGAERLRPLLAARAAQSLRHGDHSDALHVIAAFPSAQNLGENLAKAKGVPFAVEMGWLPREPVDESIAVELAWALHDAGHPAESLRVLGDSPEMAFHQAILQAEQGGEPSMPSDVPDDVLGAPGVLIDREEILENEDIHVFFAAEKGASEVVLEATGQHFLGPPEVRLLLAGKEIANVRVGEDGDSWTFESDMPPGVYRLVLSYSNDHHNDNGDRNLYAVKVKVR